jgi:hypothetical protein
MQAMLLSTRLQPLADFENAGRAGQSGERLVRALRSGGVLSAWGAYPQGKRFVSESQAEHTLRMRRGPVSANNTDSYRGVTTLRRRLSEYVWEWSADTDSLQYLLDYRWLEGPDQRRRYQTIELGKADGAIERRQTQGDRTSVQQSMRMGSSFVPWPLATIAYGWVAGGQYPEALIESSTVRGHSLHWQWLRGQESQRGLKWVLVQADYDPSGMRMGVDPATGQPEAFDLGGELYLATDGPGEAWSR